jgi:hypothetical protein
MLFINAADASRLDKSKRVQDRQAHSQAFVLTIVARNKVHTVGAKSNTE